MSSKRAIRRRSCKSKQRFGSQLAASAAIGRLRRNTGDTSWMTTYRCQFCGGWHFGHTPSRIRQSITDSRHQ